MSPRNPFPAAAVARLSDTGIGTLTIPTPAVRQALRFADGYLAGDGASGNVIAIVGEYGTGKTHLALEILRHISGSRGGPSIRHLYLDAPADTFLGLYQQRFVVELSKGDVRARVGEYYADIVADALAGSELTGEVARRLRAREIEAAEVVSRLGLMESVFIERLQERLRDRLRAVTANDAFGTALTLFLRPEFEDAVWEWLRGAPPDPALAERGVTAAIDTDTAALEAIGVFALLYGQQNRRFILVVDELEKVLSPPHPPAHDAILAFKRLLEVFAGARALLVLCGLPDFLDALPEDVRQRIGAIVRPSALGLAETRAYILDAQERAGAGRTLDPFGDDALAYLVELAGGTARKIIKLCHHAYQRASAAGTGVTRPLIREIAREQFELTSHEDVRAEIARVLDTGGWLFETRAVFGGARPDFWVPAGWAPAGEGGSGCAILVTDSVLDAAQNDALVERARTIRREGEHPRAVLIVVNGHLADALAPRLTGAGNRPPLVYSGRRFAEDLDAAVKGVMQRLERAGQPGDLAALRDRVDRIGRQQTRLLEAVVGNTEDLENIGQTLTRLTEMAAAERRRRLEEPEAEGDLELVVPAEEEADDDRVAPKGRQFPRQVAQEFEVTFTALRRLDVVAADQRQHFAAGEMGDVIYYDRDAITAVGVRAALQAAAEAFHASVERWHAENHGDVGDAALGDLAALCRIYDRIYLSLPAHKLSELALHELWDQSGMVRRIDIDTAELSVRTLATRVYDAMVSALSGPSGGRSSG